MANNKNKDSQKDTSKEIKIEDNSQETIKEKVEANEVETDATNEQATDEINELKEQLASLQDKYLRQIAEFDNYRKRILKEKSELILNGGEKVISSLLPVLDDFERALINIKKGGDETTLLQGTELIYQKLLSTLESQGLSKIKTEKEDFNTDFHEAVAMVPVDDESMKGKVVDCVQTGYTLNNKVIRHSKVAVGQ
jgi:molecular chaperone GrpE